MGYTTVKLQILLTLFTPPTTKKKKVSHSIFETDLFYLYYMFIYFSSDAQI
jgi:hypothetical protein